MSVSEETKAKIAKHRASIAWSREQLEKGLILDPEAASQIRRMCYYYEEKCDRAEAGEDVCW